MQRMLGSRDRWLLLGAMLVAAAPLAAQRPDQAGQREAVVREARLRTEQLREAALRAVTELGASRARLVRYAEGLAGPTATPLQLDSLVRLRRMATEAELRAMQASARHQEARHRLEVELMARAASMATVSARAPQGYLGVSVMELGSGTADADGGGSPRIASVEPGSPAAKAGLRAGDRLVSVGNVVLRDGGDLGALLRPGEELRVRFERAGRAQEARVRIEPRPAGFEPGLSISLTEVPSERAVIRMIPAPGVQVLSPTRQGERVMQRAIVQGVPDADGAMLVVTTRRTNLIAGAEVTQMDSTLRRATGAARGLYVLSVIPGLHTARAGVRQGDVLVRAGDAVLDTPYDLFHAFEARRAAGSLAIELLRDRKAQTVEIRW